jgi:hypothetical protein
LTTGTAAKPRVVKARHPNWKPSPRPRSAKGIFQLRRDDGMWLNAEWFVDSRTLDAWALSRVFGMLLSWGFTLDDDRSEGNGRPWLHDSAKVKGMAKRIESVAFQSCRRNKDRQRAQHVRWARTCLRLIATWRALVPCSVENAVRGQATYYKLGWTYTVAGRVLGNRSNYDSLVSRQAMIMDEMAIQD